MIFKQKPKVVFLQELYISATSSMISGGQHVLHLSSSNVTYLKYVVFSVNNIPKCIRLVILKREKEIRKYRIC